MERGDGGAAMVFAEGPLQSVEFLVTVGLLIGALLAGAGVIYVTDLWRKKQVKPTREGIESLSLYRDLYEAGELDEVEYRGIRDRFARELKSPPAPGPHSGSVGEASGANLDDSPPPPAAGPGQAPPIS